MINNKRKPIGKRNGLNIYTRLATKTKLKANKPMKLITPKQQKINHNWAKVTEQRTIEEKNICQWCKQPGNRSGWNPLTGHHIIKRRYNIHTKDNCYVVHWNEHQYIENNSIDVSVYPNKEAWEKRND